MMASIAGLVMTINQKESNMPIFNNDYDLRYKKVFAWFPVALYGPDEWDRCKTLNCGERLVWLRWVWRFKTKGSTYYAIPGDHTRNQLLQDSISGRETSYEKRYRKV